MTSIKTALGEATREVRITIPLSEITLITTEKSVIPLAEITLTTTEKSVIPLSEITLITAEKSVMTLIMPGLQANRGPMAEHLLLGETLVTPGESVMS